jgi:hypothetical protein
MIISSFAGIFLVNESRQRHPACVFCPQKIWLKHPEVPTATNLIKFDFASKDWV